MSKFDEGHRLAEDSAEAVDADVPLLEHLRKEEVLDDDRDERCNERFRTRSTNPARPRAAGKALVTTDQTNAGPEKYRLENPFHNLPRIDPLGRVVPVRPVGHVERPDSNH